MALGEIRRKTGSIHGESSMGGSELGDHELDTPKLAHRIS